MDSTLIALNPALYSEIEIQLTILKQGKMSYINSVNIIYKKRIIKKIKINGVKKKYTQENVDSIITSYFNKILESQVPSKKEINTEAKKRAASDIMNDFNF